MEKTAMTSPITGVQFEGLKLHDGRVLVRNPLNNKPFYMRYNAVTDSYEIPRYMFAQVETITMAETADLLNVSRQRVSQIAQTNVITPHSVNGETVFIKSDVLDYRENRKVGKPKKEL